MMETEFKAMNSTIKLVGMDLTVQAEIEQMFYEFEQKASRFIPNNGLSFINNSSLQVPVNLDEILADLLDQSLKLARKANYYVHPFLGEGMMAMGYTNSFQDLYHPVFKDMEIVEKESFQEPIERLTKRWLIKKQDFSFDFGGFGKGYIIDQAKKLLINKGLNRSLINAGGDITVIGTYDVGIEHPLLMGKDMMKLSITDCALATSSKNYRKWTKDGKSYHHILNGLTGKPAFNGVLQASVVAKTAMEAETATKILCILPFEQAKAFLYERFSRIAYFVYFENDQIAIGGDTRVYKGLEVAS